MAKKLGTLGWIGIEDIKNEGKFVYHSTQKPLLFSLWGLGQPYLRPNREDCAELKSLENAKWNDTPCQDSLRFVCEK